jgi:hypothetical protein
MADFTIQGRDLDLPIEVRDASQWAAQFLVPADAAQDVVAPTGLEVATPFPGRSMLSLAFVQYRDTDLDAYHEVAVSFVVRPHDAPPAAPWERVREFWSGQVGAYIHQLPVDQEFTLEAGRTIWGFPKFLASIDITTVGRRTVCALWHDGQHVFTLDVRRGGPVRLPQQAPPSYSFVDGVLRRTEWRAEGTDRGAVPGGAEIELGEHPIAKELSTLGLPRRALMTASVGHLRASFDGPEVIR